MGFPKWGYPKSWMVFVREDPTKMDENWGYPYFRKPPNINQGTSGSQLSN